MFALPSSASEIEARVYWVVDGDSFKFERKVDVPIEDECRTLHYNAPETRGSEKELGKRATEKLDELIMGKRVLIRALDHTDQYGRWLCDVWLQDETYVNSVMRLWLEDIGYAGVGKYDGMERR